MRNLPRFLALGTLTALALSGCVRLEMNFDLNSDNTADAELISALSQEAMAEAGSDALEGLLETDDVEGVVTERYESEDLGEDGKPAFVGTRTTVTDQPLDELDFYGGNISVTRDGDDYVVSGTPVDVAAETGGLMADDAEVTMSFTFPGSVSDHNGELDDTTVTWDLTTHTGPIEARGSATEGGFPTWLMIVVIALVGVGIGMAIVLVSASRRKPLDEAREEGDLEGEGGIQGTVDTADAGESTVATEPDPVVETEQVVDTTEDESPGRA